MIRLSHGRANKRYNGPYINVEIKTFKGGEINVVLPDAFTRNIGPDKNVRIIAHITNSDLVMAFFLTIDALRRFDPAIKISAFIPYLPYARQDRVCNPGEALSISLFAKLVNAMNLESVVLLDPHSDVSAAAINNSVVATQETYITYVLVNQLLRISTDNLWLVAPDAGAVKKIKALSTNLEKLGLVSGFITATKSRNLQTQEITEVRFDEDVKGKNLLVVDDICDGGRTFTGLANILRERGCNELSLFVTHGIFSYGVDELCGWYDRIYTTDSFHPCEYSDLRKYTRDLKNSEGLSRFYWFQS